MDSAGNVFNSVANPVSRPQNNPVRRKIHGNECRNGSKTKSSYTANGLTLPSKQCTRSCTAEQLPLNIARSHGIIECANVASRPCTKTFSSQLSSKKQQNTMIRDINVTLPSNQPHSCTKIHQSDHLEMRASDGPANSGPRKPSPPARRRPSTTPNQRPDLETTLQDKCRNDVCTPIYQGNMTREPEGTPNALASTSRRPDRH